MRILPLLSSKNSISLTHNFKNIQTDHVCTTGYEKDIFEKQAPHAQITFSGNSIHLFDGGIHGDNMRHFAYAINNDMNVEYHPVQTNPKEHLAKQLVSLLYELRQLPETPVEQDEYIAIPGLCSVPILNIEAQYNRVMGDNIQLSPENIKSNKHKLLSFLRKLHENPDAYRELIGYMDPNEQGLEYAYPIIQEINKRVANGYNVYIPAGHPDYQGIKWLTKTSNTKPELYHYLATGEDIDSSIEKISEYIKENRWSEFNLLNLSNAKKANLKGLHGKELHIYAANDTCSLEDNIVERGSYNFCPIRKGREIQGFSYTDTSSNQYPYEEFKEIDSVSNILEFVGLPIDEVLANEKETERLQKAIAYNRDSDMSFYTKKLYNVNDFFSENTQKEKKINLMGRYTDAKRELFFDVNNDGMVVFEKFDCDGSKRPSVMTMWGTCFAIFNAIAKDIQQKN